MIGLFLNLLDTQSEKDKFIKLYDKYKNMLYWISYGKTQSCQDAEECVQETFFYVAKHFEKIGDVNSSQTKGYLATIVTGFSIDVYNKSKKYGLIDIENNNMAENLSYFDNIETVELSSAIESVLSEEEKIYIYLKYVYGYKSAEIAEIYNVTDISVRKKLERAKAKLKNILRRKQMTNFEEACKMSAEKWVASFPDEVEAHKFSQKHIDAINEIIYPKPAVKVKKLSKKTVRFIIIAAVLLALATTAIASPAFRQFTLKDFSNHSEYRVGDIKNAKAVSSLKLNYIPDEFKMVDKSESEAWFNYSYKMGEQKFEVEKLNLRSSIGFDTENSIKEELQINGADAAYYRTADNWGTVIFNNGEYIYYIGGNISKEELVKIAQNVE